MTSCRWSNPASVTVVLQRLSEESFVNVYQMRQPGVCDRQCHSRSRVGEIWQSLQMCPTHDP